MPIYISIFTKKNAFMKRIISIAVAFIIGFTAIQGCSTLTGTTGGGSTSTSSSSWLGNILSAIIGMMGNIPGLSGLSNLNANTSLSSIINNAATATAFKNALATKFQIPLATVNSAYSSFNTLTDVANFVNKNASTATIKSLK